MNKNLKLLPLISLITLTSGFFVTTNIAEAASSAPTQPSIEKDVHHSEGHQEPTNVSQVLFSKKAQKIEFFTLLGIIGSTLIVPEVFKKSKQKSSQNNQLLNSDAPKESLQAESPAKNNVEPDISYLQDILSNTKKIDLIPDNLVSMDEHKKNGFKNENQPERKIS